MLFSVGASPETTHAALDTKQIISSLHYKSGYRYFTFEQVYRGMVYDSVKIANWV
jgi:hypothetical protein